MLSFLKAICPRPGEAGFWNSKYVALASSRFEVLRQGPQSSLAAVVVPEHHSSIAHHGGHLDCVISNMLGIMRSIDETKIDRIRVRSWVE